MTSQANAGSGPRVSRVVRAVNVVFLIVGLGALWWMVRKVGVDELSRTIRSVGWWAVALVATSLLDTALSARAIHVFMRPEQRMVSYWRVLAAQISGQAVNAVTPTGTLGEVVKTTLLVGHAPRYRAVSSVVVYNVVYGFVVASLMLVAIVISLVFGDLPSRIDWILRIAFIVLFAGLAAVVLVTRRGLVRSFLDIARHLRVVTPQRRARVVERLEVFDDQLRLIGRDREASIAGGIGYVALARILSSFDLWLILVAIGHPQPVVFVVIATAAGMIIKRLASIVPLGIGAAEGGQAGLFAVLGPGAAIGLAVSLIERLRSVLIAGLGLTVMLVVQVVDHGRARRSRRRLLERAEERSKRANGADDDR